MDKVESFAVAAVNLEYTLTDLLAKGYQIVGLIPAGEIVTVYAANKVETR